MKSLFFKYFFRSLLLLAISILALSFSFIVGASQILNNTEKERMERTIEPLMQFLENFADETDDLVWNHEADRAFSTISEIGDLHLKICDENGFLLFAIPEEPIGGFIGKELFSFCKGEGQLPLLYTSPTISRTVTRNNITQGYIIVSSFQTTYNNLIKNFMKNWLLASALLLFFAGTTAYFVARRMTTPLREMATCAHSFAHGNFSVRVKTENISDGETLELANAFNAMAENLQNGEVFRRGFIANVSHELKTPMTTIAGFVGGILDGTVPKDEQEEKLKIVYDETLRLSRLVVSMTNISRLQTGQIDLLPRNFDIAELTVRIMFNFEQKITEKGLNVDIKMPEDQSLWVYADVDSIIQVLTNLIDNAIKFSDPGSDLEIYVGEKQDKAHISVVNYGPTIPREDLPYIFDRFHKADHSRSYDKSGIGLGLFLVRSILFAHNEVVNAISENGRTEFSFSLRLSDNR